MMNGRMMDGWGMTWGMGLFYLLIFLLLVLSIAAVAKYLSRGRLTSRCLGIKEPFR
jgi:hypothetical protein